MQLNWMKCQGDVWCKLNFVNLDHEHFNDIRGVYIIWHGGPEPAVVYVGQGNIKQRLAVHRNDPDIQQHKHLDLYVTWAAVSEESRLGVEAYLIDMWDSKENAKSLQTVHRIVVNSPWQ